jgi:acyl-CoA synthetase (AMP-forming)/AMP-acid ligase II
MTCSPQSNFGGRLFQRLGDRSDLIDAATGETIPGARVPGLIAGFADGFRAAGLEPGERILIGCNVSPASTLAYLGALYAGLTVVLMNERALPSSGEALFRRTRARCVWTERGSVCDWAQRNGFLHLVGSFSEPGSHFAPPAPRSKHDLAVLMPTSGSTGAPRLVQVTHENLIANTEAIVRSQRLASNERALLLLPISYCFGASVMHTHLHEGGSIVYDSRFMFPDTVLRAIQQHQCTTFAGVPTVYSILLRRSNIGSIALPTLRRLLQAGGHLAAEEIRQMRTLVPHAEFFVMYGQTEATSRISCLPPSELSRKLGSVGLPLDNLSVRIVDENGQEARCGEPGEIWVRGPSVCSSYFDGPEETSRKFRDGWLVTGDIAFRDSDGYLWVVGRKGEFIKMRGIRVSYAEIEERVTSFPEVSECAVTAVKHAEAGEAMVLYVVAARAVRDIKQSVRRNLPHDWICDSVYVVRELPRNFHGKLDRARLSALVQQHP